ncbi:MAG TPA: Tad domain-containing protein [Sphingomicrobium sp.]|nr:Tad domain-containing protein [Sphingomicrobium sp.]
MISFIKRLCHDRRGNALAIGAAALPLLIGSAGLATDTIQWALWKRQLQRAADSAAMAGVYAKVSGQTLDDCSNVAGATYDKPIAYDVKQNNFVGIETACTAQNSPSSGPYSSDPHAVRVRVAVQKTLSFSSMFMSSPPTIEATATATIVPGGEYCVVSLENTSTTGITATGSATVNMGCGMITNSTSMSAAIATGSSSVTASPIAAVGGISASSNWGAGTTLQPFTMAQDDPFANVQAPVPTNCQKFSDWVGNNNKPGGVIDLTTSGSPIAPGGTFCLKENGGTLDISANVTLPKGTYVLDATSLKMTNTSASLKCHECTFVLTSSTAATNPGSIGTISLQGGRLDMTAASDGLFKGLMFYQDRRAPYANNITNLINGNSSSSLLGAAYFPNQKLTFNGTSGMKTECLQLVARIVDFSGNNSISNNCPPGSGANSFKGRKVRLVA